MKKWLILLAVLLLAGTAQAQFVGSFGQYFVPEDTGRIIFAVHDTTGLDLIDWDSGFVARYYRGVQIDSVDQSSGQISSFGGFTGLYEYKFKADPEGVYSGTDEDTIGVFNVVIWAYVKEKLGVKPHTYQVFRGNGLNALFDVRWFLGAADNAYRVLHPPSGIYPKDSTQYYSIIDKDGDGSIGNGDTTHVSTIIFYHSNVSRVLDSSKIFYHRADL